MIRILPTSARLTHRARALAVIPLLGPFGCGSERASRDIEAARAPAAYEEIGPEPEAPATEQTWLDLWHQIRRDDVEKFRSFAAQDPAPLDAEAAKGALCVLACDGPGPWLIHHVIPRSWDCYELAWKAGGVFHRAALDCMWLEQLCVEDPRPRVVEFDVTDTTASLVIELETGHWEEAEAPCPPPADEDDEWDCTVCNRKLRRCEARIELDTRAVHRDNCSLL